MPDVPGKMFGKNYVLTLVSRRAESTCITIYVKKAM